MLAPLLSTFRNDNAPGSQVVVGLPRDLPGDKHVMMSCLYQPMRWWVDEIEAGYFEDRFLVSLGSKMIFPYGFDG